MKKVIYKPTETETVLVSETTPDKFYLVVRDKPEFTHDVNFLRYEFTQGWIFRFYDNMKTGHCGHSSTYNAAIQNIVNGWTVYQFDSMLEAVTYINSLNLVRSS